MLPGLLTFSTAILSDFCSSIAIDIGKKKTLSFLEEQGEPIINHRLARALIRALSGSLIEQLNAWCETPEGTQNKDYVSFAIKQLQVISDETNEKNADWTEFLEKFNSTSLNQVLGRIRCNQPIQASDLGKKAIESLNGFFSDPAQNQKALSNFCDFLCKEEGALFNCNLYESFREEIIKDPVTFNNFTIDFLSQIYTGIENAFPNSKALADTLSNITVSLDKINAKVDTVGKKIDTVPEKVVELLQASCIPIKNGEQREQIPKMLTHYNPSELPKYPKKLKKFVTENRADELRKALTYLENHRILLISGVGGVGKSTFARALVELSPSTVPEPFWFSFYENPDAKLGDILEKLAAYLKTPEIIAFKSDRREPGKIDVNKLTGELHRRSKIWLFFDDLNTVLEDTKFSDKGIEILFSSLRYGTHNANIIVTSRILPKLGNEESLIDVVEGEEKQHLNGLITDFAVDYLVKNGLGSLEPNKLKELANGVDGHPLALKLLVELVKEFGEKDILDNLNIYQEQKQDTILKARKLFDKLAGNEKALLERISVYREPVKIKGLKEMFVGKSSLTNIQKLINKSLLETDTNSYYWLHPLVQEFSYDDLENKKEVHKLAMNYYLSLPIPKKPAKKGDIQALIEAHYHACMAQEYDQAFNIIIDNDLHEYLDLWGNYSIIVDLYSKLLPENHFGTEILLKNKGRHSIIIGNLGLAYFYLGETKKAIEYYEQGLEIYKQIKNRQGEGNQLGNLGVAYSYLGETKKAIEYYEQGLEIHKQIKNRQGEGTLLGNLGIEYKNLGEPRKAIEYYEQALKIAQEIGDRQGEENQLGNLGVAYSYLGETEKSIEYYEQAVKINKEIGNRRLDSIVLGNLGAAYSDLGEIKKAIEYYEQALKIAREIKDKRKEGSFLGNLGIEYKNLGELRKAIEFYEQALKIAREIRDRRGEGNQLANLGITYSKLGDTKKATEYYKQALKIYKEIEDRQGEGNQLANLGLVYGDLGEASRAIEYHKKALRIFQGLEDRRGEEGCLVNLGIVYKNLGELRKAIEYCEQALKIAREIRDRRGEGIVLGNLRLAYGVLGEPRKVIEYCEQALKIAQEIEDKQLEESCLGNLGNTYSGLGELRKAIEYYKQALKIAKEIGDRQGEGGYLGNLGNTYSGLGEMRKAIEYYEQALKIAKEIGNKQLEGSCLGNLGIEYKNLRELKKAIEYYEQALKIAQEIRDRQLEGSCFGNLGNSYYYLGELRKAIEYYEQALKIHKQIKDRRGEGIDLGNLGIEYSELGETKKAIEYYKQALRIAREIRDRRNEGIWLGNLGLAYNDLGEMRKAIEYYEQALKIDKLIENRRGEGIDLSNMGFAYKNLGKIKEAIEYFEQALKIAQETENRRSINFCEKNLKELKTSNIDNF